MKRNLISLSAMALLLSGQAFSAAPTTATTSTSVSAAVAALNFSSNCAGGGTRVSTGTWDATSGALSLSSTDTACVGTNGESHDGARTLNGTLLLNGASSYTVDITVQESFTVTRDGVTKLQHTCTFARKGSFDSTTDIFTGAVSHNNCVDTGEVWDHQHGIESLLRDSNVIDVPQPPPGVTPPQKPSGANMPQLPSDATPPTINAGGAITIKLPSGATPPPSATVNSDGTVTFTPSLRPLHPTGATTTTSGA
ncbi:MAG: hypothetical protein WC091_06885 [Sulfuricellaceae bacterium]